MNIETKTKINELVATTTKLINEIQSDNYKRFRNSVIYAHQDTISSLSKIGIDKQNEKLYDEVFMLLDMYNDEKNDKDFIFSKIISLLEFIDTIDKI